MAKISFIKSDDRKYNIERCLALLKSEIAAGIKNARRVVIKPNCLYRESKLSATHVDALDALLGFIKPLTNTQIVIADGTIDGDTFSTFKDLNYLTLQEKYDFTILDLNSDDFEEIELYKKNGGAFTAKIAKTIIESDYLISIAPPKTSAETLYSGGTENIVRGALLRSPSTLSASMITANKFGIYNFKTMINQGDKLLHKNIARIAKYIPISLSIIDGYEAMEGNGPVNGELLPTHFAVASSDSLGADMLACQMLGIDPSKISYLSLLGLKELDKYIFAGDSWQKSTVHAKLPDKFSNNFWA